ncbi:hypothetical protein Cri9333_2234 [Crinalium epipsammum PCC 9333]|uniref:DUF5357 domain-containing protein n=1 Tax=Crinalium epipsammum PCC 9333 TaxID=1173022 RepID=K9W115_9CYAN|nr:DUF5357 family protein [Crinalium epipsammum]AFZ13105.1 hypothetical protein Cri9333_2234 [Crinalium epipsammum PCC 9333]
METVIGLVKWLQRLLSPPRAFSWETLVLLSLFSCFMAYISTGIVRGFISNCGWIFLIFGVGWGTAQKRLRISNISLSPWITGALVSTYIFGNISQPNLSVIFWPTISAVIATIPNYFGKGLKLQLPNPKKRQNMIVFLLSHVVISCWFQFYYVLQDWLQQYPSLLADDLKRSAFVLKLPASEPATIRGTLILNFLETKLSEKLDNKPWSVIERWLLEREKNLELAVQDSKKELGEVEEYAWWQFTSKLSSTELGYNLQLIAIWEGPRSKSEKLFIEKLCKINRVSSQSETDTNLAVGQVECQPAKPINWR